MRTLVSIDIDYWNFWSTYTQEKHLRRYLDHAVRTAQQKCVPIVAITNHQQILKWANKSKARRILSIDTHSDLRDNGCDELDCGSWVSYVKWRKEGEFHWIHKGRSDYGDCNGGRVIFQDRRRVKKSFKKYLWDPESEYCVVEWKKVRHRRAAPPKLDNLDITEIVVCESPTYSDGNLIEIFQEWRKEHNIPYLRGRKDENFGRKITPQEYK